MSKRCLLLGSLWFAASCSLYDERLLPTYELWSASERDAGQLNEEDFDELRPPALTFDAGVVSPDDTIARAGRASPSAGASASGSGGDSAAAGTDAGSGGAGSAAAGSGGQGSSAGAAAGSGGAGAGASGAGAGGAGGAGAGAGAGGASAGAGGAGAGGAGAGGAGAGGAGGSEPDPDCPESGGQIWSGNGHCYFPLSAQASWNVSRDNCNQKSAKLVTITSAGELEFVAGLLGSTPSWIGLSKFGAPQFSWSTGEALNYTNWASSEPNLSGEAAVAIRNDTHKWFDDAVSASHPAICERP